MRILLVEDNRVTRLRIKSLLTEWGNECLAVADGVEAMEQFGEFQPHIVITDWLMPRMDGIEVLKRIRERCTAMDTYVYVIMLTARSEVADMVEGLEEGADDYLRKPFETEELRVRIRAGSRIIELERQLRNKNRSLVRANHEISAINRRMRQELDAAAKIQSSFLPAEPPVFDRARFAWHYQPCDELSGDTLNILDLTDRKVGLYVVDVCGHGVSAALLSVHLTRLFTRVDEPDSIVMNSSVSGERGILETPANVAMHLNHLFPFDPLSETLQYFTMLYGILDLENRRFDYTSAGHPGPILVPADTDDETIIHEAEPPGVGFFPDAHFKEKSIELAPGDRMYLYTDGIYEMMNTAGEEFGEPRLADALAQRRDTSLEQSIVEAVDIGRDWRSDTTFEDDISLLGLEVA